MRDVVEFSNQAFDEYYQGLPEYLDIRKNLHKVEVRSILQTAFLAGFTSNQEWELMRAKRNREAKSA